MATVTGTSAQLEPVVVHGAAREMDDGGGLEDFYAKKDVVPKFWRGIDCLHR